MAGRRHGKTEAVATRIIENARPGTMQAYVAPTITRAGEIMMPILRQLQRDCGLQFGQRGDVVTFPSGGAMRLMGMSNSAEIQKLRGEDLLAAYFDECFVSGTPVRPVGKIVGRTTKVAPDVLISLDGVTSTPDHPWLTPEGWKRAEAIIPGDLLCVWEPNHEEEWTLARDVLSGVSLEGALEEPTACGLAAARAQGRDIGRTSGGRASAVGGLQPGGQSASEGARAQAPGPRRERPWAYANGTDVARSYGVADASDRADGSQRAGADTLQVGPCRRMDASGCGDRRGDAQHSARPGERRPKDGMARWQRVDRVEVHERGGRGRYAEVCPDGLVHNLRTDSGLYFAGGRLVHNCGVPKSAILKEAVLTCAWEALRKHRGEAGSGASLSGTPGAVPGNPAENEPDFWWQCTTQNGADGRPMYGASRHFGLIYDNPIFQGQVTYKGQTMSKAEASIQEDLDNKLYISREDSRFRREVLAQWCLPSELRCYSSFGKILLPNTSLPWGGRTVMAVDFGWHDHTAIVILRLIPFEEKYPQPDGSVTILKGERVHVVYACKRQHWKLPDLALKLRELQTYYSVGTIVGDSGGGGSRQVVESFAGTFGVPMIPAMKNAMGVKKSRIHTINDMFAIGHIFLYEDAAPLAEELGYLVWNEERDDHDERQGDHCADGFGYAIIETYVPVTESRIASQREQDSEAAAARKRDALNRGRR